jgi:hypothetical protein
MQQTRFSAAGIFALFASAVIFTAPAAAKDGRDFAGYYSLTNVTETAGQVEFTLALHLFNYSGADLKQAVVTLRSAPFGPGALNDFAPIKLWRNGSDVVVTQPIAIPREDFRRWSPRTPPAVSIGYRDEDGHAYRRPVQLSRRPTIAEPRPPADE